MFNSLLQPVTFRYSALITDSGQNKTLQHVLCVLYIYTVVGSLTLEICTVQFFPGCRDSNPRTPSAQLGVLTLSYPKHLLKIPFCFAIMTSEFFHFSRMVSSAYWRTETLAPRTKTTGRRKQQSLSITWPKRREI